MAVVTSILRLPSVLLPTVTHTAFMIDCYSIERASRNERERNQLIRMQLDGALLQEHQYHYSLEKVHLLCLHSLRNSSSLWQGLSSFKKKTKMNSPTDVANFLLLLRFHFSTFCGWTLFTQEGAEDGVWDCQGFFFKFSTNHERN